MNYDTVFSPPKASGGVHEQIESFLETIMRGLMRPHDREAAAEQGGKPGRPMVLPSVDLVDGRPRGNSARSEVPTGHLAVDSSRRLVEATKLSDWRSSRL
jgi:hypothetical protein